MSKHKPRVFLDTNVVFSGLHSPQGAPGSILERFIEGRISVVVSPQVLEEVIRTIKEKLPEALPALRMFLVNAPPEVGADPSPEEIRHWAKQIHPADAAILAAAIAAKPDYFVTGDNHFLGNQNIIEEAGIKIITPAQLLGLLEPDSPGSRN